MTVPTRPRTLAANQARQQGTRLKNQDARKLMAKAITAEDDGRRRAQDEQDEQAEAAEAAWRQRALNPRTR